MHNRFNNRWYVYSISALALVLCIDRLSKAWALEALATPRVLIPNVLQLSLVRNTYVAFVVALPPPVVVVATLLVMAALVTIGVRAYTQQQRGTVVCIGAIVIGAASNALDRIRFGAVIDFISVPFWSVFNVADIAIVAGVVGVAVCMRLDKTTQTASI